MILKGEIDPGNRFRISFDIDKDNDIRVRHFAVRTTTPEHPFTPHKHKREELWYITEGQGVYSEDGIDHPVESGDLIQVKPWILHGLRSDTKIVWICLG